MYPLSIREYVRNNGVPGKLSRSRKLSAPFKLFVEKCEELGFDLQNHDLYAYQSVDIRIAISEDLPAPQCKVCGVPTEFRRNEEGWYPAYCCMDHRNADPDYGIKISTKKTALYQDDSWKDKTEAKKKQTCLERFGEEFPMQVADLHRKQQQSCFQSDENGLRGYEPQGLEFLTVRYDMVEIGTDYLRDHAIKIRWQDDNGKTRASYPDFFVPELNAFVEVKSEYTKKQGAYKLEKCREALDKMEYGYIILTITPKKHIGNLKYRVYDVETFNVKHMT